MSNLIERVTTQAAGAIGAIRASVRGLHGVFLRLSEEHRETLTLLERALAATAPEKRAEVWADVRNELLAHEQAEREYVYAQLTADPVALDAELRQLVDAHQEDLAQLEQAIAHVDNLRWDSPEWPRSIERLVNQVRQHAAQEEEHLFTIAQQRIGEQRAVEIDGLYINGRRSILHALKSPTAENPADGR